MFLLAIKKWFLDNLLSIGIGLLVIGSVWGHGYYTAYQYWDNWYDKEVSRQNQVNKNYYNLGIKEAKRLQEEDKKDEENTKQLEQEADQAPNATTSVLPRSSVQRIDRY